MKSQILATKSPLKKCILKQAYAVAMSSDAPKKIGAILLKKNRIIASAVNDYHRTHPVQYWAAQNAARIFNEPQLENKIYLHGELRVLIKAKEDADTIIVCRVGGHGGQELRNARREVSVEDGQERFRSGALEKARMQLTAGAM